MNGKGKILFLLPYPLKQAPSQRFRIEAYFDLLDENGIPYDISVFMDDATWDILYKDGGTYKKISAVIGGYLKRLKVVLNSRSYDYVVIHREAAPIGPPLFEWLISRVFRKRLIYDFDDAIWIPNVTQNNKLARYAKCFWKIKHICKWSYKISAGNNYLATWAKQYNRSVYINPTCVNTAQKYTSTKNQSDRPIVIGWTGSHSTIKYLDDVYPILKQLEKTFSFEFLVICDKRPSFFLKSLRFIQWSEASEIEDLMRINIGIMPLINDSWSEGKCGFKLIQYMALGIPSIASPVGVNKTIIQHGYNGFLCADKQEWVTYLKALLQDEDLRTQFGTRGQKKIVDEYSTSSNANNFISLFS